MRKIGNLEKQSDNENPNWIPQVGEYYAWREATTRKGNLLIGRIISFDAEKKIVKGRQKSGMTERRYLADVFGLPFSEVESVIELE